MAVIVNRYVPKTFGANDCFITGSFQTNGATSGAITASTVSSPRGTLSMTVTQSGTGTYTISLPYGITFPAQPWSLVLSTGMAVLATDHFEVGQLGVTSYTNGVLSFVVQCHRAGTAFAPAATAGNRINFMLAAGDTIGG